MRLNGPATSRVLGRWSARAGGNRSSILAIALLVARICVPVSIAAQEMEVPLEIQVPLFLKAVTFDRNFTARAHSELVIGVLYQSGYALSRSVKADMHRMLRDRETVEDLPLRIVLVDLDSGRLSSALSVERVDYMYVTPLRGADIAGIAAAARAAGVSTFTGVPRYVADGLALGVRLIADRPRLLVNLTQSRAEGADYSSEFLRLAQVIR